MIPFGRVTVSRTRYRLDSGDFHRYRRDIGRSAYVLQYSGSKREREQGISILFLLINHMHSILLTNQNPKICDIQNPTIIILARSV